MNAEKLEKQKPEVKLENFRKWLEGIEERAEDYVAEQKKNQGFDKNSIKFPESIPGIEMFVESAESNLESLRERLDALRERKDLSSDLEAIKIFSHIEAFLNEAEGFLKRHRSEPTIIEWFMNFGGSQDMDKKLDVVSAALSGWEEKVAA